jgi:hypothetical protein
MLDRPLVKALLGLTKNPRQALRHRRIEVPGMDAPEAARAGAALRDRLAPEDRAAAERRAMQQARRARRRSDRRRPSAPPWAQQTAPRKPG